MNPRRTTLLLLAVLALAAPPALAATLNVPSPLYPTIQSAVNAAANNDTILIAPGEYRENVLVPAGKTGLNITTFGPYLSCTNNATVIVDGTTAPNTHGTCFDVDADGTKIQCMTLRHCSYGVDADAADVTLSKLRILHTNSDSINIYGDRFKVLDCVAQSAGSQGVVANGYTGEVRNTQVLLSDSTCFNLDGSNLTVVNNSARNCEDSYGFEVDGNSNFISQNSVEDTDGNAFDINGNSNRIFNNRAQNIEDDGINLIGDSNTIESNILENLNDEGIYVNGSGNIVRANTVKGAELECIDAYGPDVLIERNTLSWCQDGGIYASSSGSPRVLNNTIDRAGDDDGIRIYCYEYCTGGRVEGNTTSGTNNDDEGVDVYSDGSGFVVTGNTVSNNQAHGYYMSFSNGTVSGNKAYWNGTETEDGFRISGGGNLISSNIATNSGDSGIHVSGDGNRLQSNTCSGNFDEGFTVEGDGNILTSNRAFSNLGEGIENRGTNTVLQFNNSSGNRRVTDCTNDGSIAVNVGNSCADGSNFAVPAELNF